MGNHIYTPEQKAKMAESKRIAAIILMQLGGGRFTAMTGSKNYVALGNGFGCKLRRNNTKGNYMRITLNAMDTYDMEFLLITSRKMTSKSKCEGLYDDMLQSIFTRETGLNTSL